MTKALQGPALSSIACLGRSGSHSGIVVGNNKKKKEKQKKIKLRKLSGSSTFRTLHTLSSCDSTRCVCVCRRARACALV